MIKENQKRVNSYHFNNVENIYIHISITLFTLNPSQMQFYSTLIILSLW